MKISAYLNELETDTLENNPYGCQFSKMTLLLGQFRHLMYHIEYLHACLKNHTGKAPKYMGLELSI
jgi:hypothetical protein